MRILLNCRLLGVFRGFCVFPVLCPSLLGRGGLDAALTTGRCRYRRRGSITGGEGGEPFLEPPLSKIRANWLWRLIQKLACVRVALQLWLGVSCLFDAVGGGLSGGEVVFRTLGCGDLGGCRSRWPLLLLVLSGILVLD